MDYRIAYQNYCMVKQAAKTESEIASNAAILSGLLGAFPIGAAYGAYKAPEGRGARTFGHITGKGLLGAMGASMLGNLIIPAGNPVNKLLLRALMAGGSAYGAYKGYRSGASGKSFF